MKTPIAALCLLAFAPSASAARDWFVRAGSEGGDGSAAKPFGDPWEALEKCEAGDSIHVAAGKYFGKFGAAMWEIPFADVKLVGGYDKDFKGRDPWTHRSEFVWDAASKNRPKDACLQSKAKGVVVDGIVVDMKNQNHYIDPERTGRKDLALETALRFNQPATVRNCVILNPGFHGIDCTPGSTIENNLILNAIDWGVSVYTNTGDFKTLTATIRNNTIAFNWGFKEAGKGHYGGAAVQVNGPANITNNILAHSDNNAIYQTYAAEKVSISKNVFHMNLFSNLKFFIEGKDIAVDNKSMELLEEVGLKAFEGNEILDPQLDVDKGWLDQYSKRAAAQPGKLVMDDWNKLRQLKGLPLIAKGGTPATGVAPPMEVEWALKLLEPGNAACKAGARRVKLEAKLAGAAEAAPSKTYPKGSLTDWNKQPGAANEKPMEMIVAIGGVANVGGVPETYKKDQIAGVVLYDPEGKGERVTGFYMKGSNAERVCSAASGYYDGRGKPPTLFVARGIAYEVKNVPKAGFFIESIEKYEASAAAAKDRPKGRDWFVRAGSMGGNGSKDKPFRDPFQALEKCEAGDMIHVAEGEYHGKLKAGTWKIDTTYISLIGGYDKDFQSRNPWTRPTLLFCPPDFKGRRGAVMIEGAGDHTGAVIDGFVFDKRSNNVWKPSGDIDYDQSDKSEDVTLDRPGCAVRNCLFLNGVAGALRMANGQTVENNLFINHYSQTVRLSKGHTTVPAVFRNNTLLFSWEIRFGEGRGRNGHLLRIETDARAVVDNNIFEFADNDAIQLALDPQEIAITNNVFAHNLWSHVQDVKRSIVVDTANFKQLGDLGLKASTGNELLTPGLPVDQKWFDVYLNRTAYVPGKVQMDDWNQLRGILGQPLLATGGKGPAGLMPMYDYKLALALFPKNEKCRAGARASNLDVKFDGVERKEEAFEYEETAWDTAKNRDAWEKLAGKRVWLKVAIKGVTNQYPLEDAKESEYQAFEAGGLEGSDSGLPMRCFVKKGTRHERALRQAKGYGPGKPEEFHVIKGVAKPNRQMVVEAIEKAD